jgi:Trypsin-like peptidase domain/Effector-associated domain 1
MRLTRALRKQYAIALQSAYYNWNLLDELLYLDLGVPLNTITASSAMPAVILAVVAWAEGSGRTEELIASAYAKVPGNPELRAFVLDLAVAQSDRLAPTAPLWRAMEKAVLTRVAFDNPRQFRERMARAERAVCRFVLPKPGWGTGFLVGPDTVLTNYHVIEDLQLGLAKPEQVEIEFDYVNGPNGGVLAGTTPCKLAPEKWLIAFSREGSRDTDLDFALVRLNRQVGVQPAPDQPAPTLGQAPPGRGWLVPKSHAFNAHEQEPLFILQHPQLEEGGPTDPLKVTVGFISGVPTCNRVHYTTNTLKGSSGSPCFLADWELVALHHAATTGVANEGIPLKAILEDLARRDPPVQLGH